MLSPGLLDAAQADPNETFRVIVEGAAGTDAVAQHVRSVASGEGADLRSFLTVPAVAGTLTGSQIVALADGPEPLVITRDSPVVATDDPRPDEPTEEGTSEEPTVSGDAEPGHWLTATPGAWSGSGSPVYSFQWERCGDVDEVAVYGWVITPSQVSPHDAGCVAIPGAAEQAYRVAADDLGLSLRVTVTGTHEGETRVTTSGLTQPVTARPPLVVSAPSVIGTGEEGQTLNAANGTWDGTEPFEFAYQWQRCDAQGENCADIAGAEGPSYTVAPGDVGTTIRLSVTASGLGGTLHVFSEPSESVVAIPEPHARFKQHWPYVAGVASLLSSSEGTLEPPTIAIVDSGIDAGRADFGGRVIEHANLSTRPGNQPGDGYGHGTAVASVAAGEAEGYVGAAPDARLVAVEALDDEGVAYLSDVIAAADWVYLNRERLNIRVANFSYTERPLRAWPPTRWTGPSNGSG